MQIVNLKYLSYQILAMKNYIPIINHTGIATGVAKSIIELRKKREKTRIIPVKDHVDEEVMELFKRMKLDPEDAKIATYIKESSNRYQGEPAIILTLETGVGEDMIERVKLDLINNSGGIVAIAKNLCLNCIDQSMTFSLDAGAIKGLAYRSFEFKRFPVLPDLKMCNNPNYFRTNSSGSIILYDNDGSKGPEENRLEHIILFGKRAISMNLLSHMQFSKSK